MTEPERMPLELAHTRGDCRVRVLVGVEYKSGVILYAERDPDRWTDEPPDCYRVCVRLDDGGRAFAPLDGLFMPQETCQQCRGTGTTDYPDRGRAECGDCDGTGVVDEVTP